MHYHYQISFWQTKVAVWDNNFWKMGKIFFLHFSVLLKCHWPIPVSSLKNHSPAGRIYSPLAAGWVLIKRLVLVQIGQEDMEEGVHTWFLLQKG